MLYLSFSELAFEKDPVLTSGLLIEWFFAPLRRPLLKLYPTMEDWMVYSSSSSTSSTTRLSSPSLCQRAKGAVQEGVVQPSQSRGPRRLHQLVLETFISVYAMNQRVPEHVALGVGACRPVQVKES